jgi:hypothetical protein
VLSEVVVEYVTSDEKATISEIEQGMRQLLQEVGRQALGLRHFVYDSERNPEGASEHHRAAGGTTCML